MGIEKMTAWPPEVPDPFDPTRTGYIAKREWSWGAAPDGMEYETLAPEPDVPEESPAEPVNLGDIEQSAEHFRARFDLLRDEIRKTVVGQDDIVEHVITAMIAGGHLLLESMPGLGKSTLVRAIAGALSFDFERVPFTSDLTPEHLVGTMAGDGEEGPEGRDFFPGPIFCNLLLADQINHAPPRTQAALLEAMEEKSVNVGGQTRLLPESFFVLATQNPLTEGSYLLPPVQLDRFFFSLPLAYPSVEELDAILERTMDAAPAPVEPVFPGEDLILMRDFARGVLIETPVRRQIAQIVMATHPHSELAGPLVRKYVRAGASPRAGQALVLAAKIRALREGRFYVLTEDVLAFAIGVLRHRITLSPKASLDGLTVEKIVADSLEKLYHHWGREAFASSPEARRQKFTPSH